MQKVSTDRDTRVRAGKRESEGPIRLVIASACQSGAYLELGDELQLPHAAHVVVVPPWRQLHLQRRSGARQAASSVEDVWRKLSQGLQHIHSESYYADHLGGRSPLCVTSNLRYPEAHGASIPPLDDLAAGNLRSSRNVDAEWSVTSQHEHLLVALGGVEVDEERHPVRHVRLAEAAHVHACGRYRHVLRPLGKLFRSRANHAGR